MPPRRFLRIILPALFALVLPITTFSQSPAPRDLRAIAILQQSFAAMGGAVPVDCVATGSITIDAGGSSETGNIRILARGFDQSVEETQVSEGTFRRGYSRGRAVDKRGKRLSMEAALSSQSTVLPIQLIAQALTDPESAFEYVGVADMDGSAVRHIRFWKTFAKNQKLHPLAPLSTKDIYIDAVSGLPRKIAFEERASRGPGSISIQIEVAYSDFRGIGGSLFPFRVERFVNGTSWAIITISSVSTNSGLSEADFRIQ